MPHEALERPDQCFQSGCEWYGHGASYDFQLGLLWKERQNSAAISSIQHSQFLQ